MTFASDNLARLAQSSLCLWDIPKDSRVRLINVSENTTYLVETPNGERRILRVHRRGYHSPRAILSELSWIKALRKSHVVATPRIVMGLNQEQLQIWNDDTGNPYHLVMFEFADGAAPDESDDLTAQFQILGQLAAKLHNHTSQWTRPEGFTRLSWGVSDVFGPSPHWGDWRDAPNIDAAIKTMLERCEIKVTSTLTQFGNSADRYGLIHADMRLANLLVSGDSITLIDFDDCGFGWFLYDFAAAISFFEHQPNVPDLKEAWFSGYRQIRELPETHSKQMDSLIMLRRMALLAWIGSHQEAPEPQALAPHFAQQSAELAERYLMNGL